MLYLFKLIFLLIDIKQETVLNWLGLEDPRFQGLPSTEYGNDASVLAPSADVSLETFRLIIDAIWLKLQTGLVLADIEAILFFIVFIRYLILAIRYNLKTALYITCIGIFSGYLWYRHFIELVSWYQVVLFKVPITRKLAMEIYQFKALKDIRINNPVSDLRWSNPAGIIWRGLVRGSHDYDRNTMRDPISMLFANVPERFRDETDWFYYTIYRDFGPQVLSWLRRLSREISSLAAYTFATRIGKKYCPYFVRWHWTFILVFGFFERIFIGIAGRASQYNMGVVLPKMKQFGDSTGFLTTQYEMLNIIMTCIVFINMAFVIWAMLHAFCGQYFYFPFIVENTELHIGKRPKTIYSGGYTAWQDRDQTDVLGSLNTWYGWFGRGRNYKGKTTNKLQKFINKLFKKFRLFFRR